MTAKNLRLTGAMSRLIREAEPDKPIRPCWSRHRLIELGLVRDGSSAAPFTLSSKGLEVRATMAPSGGEVCGHESSGGRMVCFRPKGHDPHAGVRRLHTGYALNGARRNWWEWIK